MECTEVLNHRQQDLAALKQEHAILAQSERQLRTERSRVQAELALYRERVREMDDERRRVFKAVQTRGALADAAFQRCLNDSEGSIGVSADPGTASGSGSGSGMFQGTGLLAGPAGGAYLRSEDLHSGSEQLEAALAELQDELLHHQPSLLPMLRRVGEELHEDRVKFLTVQARLLTIIESVQGQGRAQARAQHQGPRLNAGVGLGPATNVFSAAGTGAGAGVVTGAGPNAGLLAGVTGMVDPGPGSWPSRRKRETFRKSVVMEEPKKFVF